MTWLFHPYRRFALLGVLLYAGTTWLGYRMASEQDASAKYFSVSESCERDYAGQNIGETTADTVAVLHHFKRVKAVGPLARRIDPLVVPGMKIPRVVRLIPPPPPLPPPPRPSKVSCGGFTFSERLPVFPGCDERLPYEERKRCGEQKLLEFIYANVRYPAHAREQGCAGIAVIEFIVGKAGDVEAAQIVADPGCGLGKAALVAVLEMNRQGIVWGPGWQHGRPVRVEYRLPVRFKLA